MLVMVIPVHVVDVVSGMRDGRVCTATVVPQAHAAAVIGVIEAERVPDFLAEDTLFEG
jgi:hypothetical protein